MTQLNCFEETSLKELKNKFLEATKEVTDYEEKQIIGISLVLERYKQLHKLLNSLRRASGLSNLPLEVYANLLDIKNKYADKIEKLQSEISDINATIKEQSKELRLKTRSMVEETNDLDENIESTDQELITIQIGNKKYEVELARSEEEQEAGLSNRDSLGKNKGMLFVFDSNESRGFWMKDTLIPLDIVFIDEDLIVTAVHEGIPNTNTLLEEECTYVLEINPNSGIKEGDELSFEPKSKKVKKSDKMLVLDSGGEVQMELDGGERIFSRKHTKTLIQFAKKAAATNNENDYRALGKRMFKFLEVQSNTEPEYVESKN